MIIFYIRDGIRKRSPISVARLPTLGSIVTGHGEVWKIDRDDKHNIQVHCR